eukprot:m.160212 g.160212  ORF g.160212 m.160212 type:complete len:90 (-) comp14347_c0_seq1:1195-1464(-)
MLASPSFFFFFFFPFLSDQRFQPVTGSLCLLFLVPAVLLCSVRASLTRLFLYMPDKHTVLRSFPLSGSLFLSQFPLVCTLLIGLKWILI